jgi:hypothetical protein
LLEPQQPVPHGVVGPAGQADVRRFSVYRNNVIVSLIDALKARFPVVCALVGEEFFGGMARVFVPNHLPRTPLMFRYGEQFPEFIAAFEPARSVLYLADIARLEIAWSEAYHSAEATALPPAALQDVNPEQLVTSTLRLHPSLQLLRSRFPVASIWSAHQAPTQSNSVDLSTAQDVLIVRPDSDVALHRLPAGGFAFVQALQCGQTLEHAATAALHEHAEFEAGTDLLNLFAAGAVIGIDPPSEQS